MATETEFENQNVACFAVKMIMKGLLIAVGSHGFRHKSGLHTHINNTSDKLSLSEVILLFVYI